VLKPNSAYGGTDEAKHFTLMAVGYIYRPVKAKLPRKDACMEYGHGKVTHLLFETISYP